MLQIKNVRTVSGVTPLTVLTKPYPCPGRCIFCPNQKGVPKSYLDDEPAVRRAVRSNYDPYKQVQERLQTFKKIGHPVAKIELIILGGTFTFYPKNYQKEFIKRCFDAVNYSESKNIQQAHAKNESTKQRIVGLSIETRPDQINKNMLIFLRKLGVTKVELGVQTLDEKVLAFCQRDTTLRKIQLSTLLLRDFGFKICYHMMPNLPCLTPKKDLNVFKKLFSQKYYQPDMLKIYPCMVLKKTLLYDLWKQGKYKTYDDKTLIDLLIRLKLATPRYVRINRIFRDIPVDNIQSGSRLSHIRKILKEKMKAKSLFCKCIRCREIKGQKKLSVLYLNKINYKTPRGKEVFLEYVDNHDRLYGLCRLSLPPINHALMSALNKAALIRELHVFGPSLEIGKKDIAKTQQRGLGKKLLQKAEEQAERNGYLRLAVTSAIGTREYYKNLGYKLSQTYMVKDL